MNRELGRLSDQIFDLLIIGGGIYGAAIAWDAALRGLSVALIEMNDFGHATSANSLKVVHGGLRYLQDASPRLVRRMALERRALMQMAPHLVRPLPFLLPTRGMGIRSRPIMKAALIANDLLSRDRNSGLPSEIQLPAGFVLKREELNGRVPWESFKRDISGAAVWHDAQVLNSERLVLSMVKSAASEGAVVANRVEATRLRIERGMVRGAEAVDHLTNETLEIEARITVNAAGPWVDRLLSGVRDSASAPVFRPSIAVNLVTRKLHESHAIGLHPGSSQAFLDATGAAPPSTVFIVPWRSNSLIGTFHFPYEGPADPPRLPIRHVAAILDLVNETLPSLELSNEDIRYLHQGLLPSHPIAGSENVRLVREGSIIDHQLNGGVGGLITVLGVKYTACRWLAEQAVNIAFRKLGRKAPECRTNQARVAGGEIESVAEFLSNASDWSGDRLTTAMIDELFHTYGTEYAAVIGGGLEKQAPLTEDDLLRAQTLYAVREEMAHSLADVVLRRTYWAAEGAPPRHRLERSAGLMGQELGWSDSKKGMEIEAVQARFPVALGID